MPPKKRAAPKTKATPDTTASKRPRRGAKVEEPVQEELVEEPVVQKEEKDSIAAKLREADKNDKKPKIYLPDKYVPNKDWYTVYKDYDCKLNQTNIGNNNNKFYIIQLLTRSDSPLYYLWNRWGRVGEIGQNNGLETIHLEDKAIQSFEKKFKDKTKNDWKNRENFVPQSGKYTLIDMDTGAQEEETSVVVDAKPISLKDCKPSKLDKQTLDLVTLLFDQDMFKGALKEYDIDVKKMPLGKLSKTQIAKGFEVLEEIEIVLKSKKSSNAKLNDLANKFYTIIPQDFGRQRPPPINDQETLQKKYEMLTVLSDIELAQSLQEDGVKEKKEVPDNEKQPHPVDVNYDLLKCKLELLDKDSQEFKIIQNYTNETQGYYKCGIIDVWKVDRENEDQRFKEFDSLDNRKLLWHGTSVAVVAAILKTGLRIMPHSGGRVGKGIYFASENGKSSGYVGTTQVNKTNIGIMFLNEVALGKEHHITRDDPSLTKAPNGYDCVIARGMTEPDPNKDSILELDGKKVIVPQGKPINTNINSSFSQSEYLIYNEGQNRIRYLLKMKFGH
ncbi:unnamed protein product [Brachionus calyciflorus]|uniref:Poly [ADP-ribose] polymerase n=1 Tax=Brachionus calyciflorus TaxID=104777 RepID=A0A814BTN1_9BILA|nr:unnamed protein product [Brachionus calyciflorus]